jgi:hypothetical protein
MKNNSIKKQEENIMGMFFTTEDGGWDDTPRVVEVEVDKTNENFKRKTKEIKEFIENSEKIKKNISLKYFYITNDDDIAEKLDKGTEQDKRNFVSGNYFLDREEAEKFIDTQKYKHRFWIADNEAKERMARIKKKIQQIKDEEPFFSETSGILDESEMIPEIEDLELEPEYDDGEPVMDEPEPIIDEPKPEPEYK